MNHVQILDQEHKEKIDHSNGWISVDDKLPEDESRVLIWYRYKDSNIEKSFVCEYLPIEARWCNVLDDITILFWQPIMEPNK